MIGPLAGPVWAGPVFADPILWSLPMFISTAFAQAAGAPSGGSGIEAILPLVLIFVVFYFLLIRPQQKMMTQHKAMLGSVRRGDRVVTGGGIVGTVTKVIDDNEITVEIAPDVKVRVQKALLSTVMSKTEPVNDDKKSSGSSSGGDGEKGSASGLKGLLGGKK
jgi:preprotein translocase subunit YajC